MRKSKYYNLFKKSSVISFKSITKQYKDLQNNTPAGISACPDNDEYIYHWHGYIGGQEDSPFVDGIFLLENRISPLLSLWAA